MKKNTNKIFRAPRTTANGERGNTSLYSAHVVRAGRRNCSEIQRRNIRDSLRSLSNSNMGEGNLFEQWREAKS